MAKQLNEDFELEKKRSGKDNTKPAPRGKLHPLADLLARSRAFIVYPEVVLSVFPNKGTELAVYYAMIIHRPDSCELAHYFKSSLRIMKWWTSPV